MAYQFQRELPSRGEVSEYNRKLKALQPEYEKYLEARRVYEIFPFRVVPIELVLRNSGGKPAEKVKITLQMPEGVAILLERERPAKPERPSKPELPGLRRGSRASSRGSVDVLKALAHLTVQAAPGCPEPFFRGLLPEPGPFRGHACSKAMTEDGREVAEYYLGGVSNFEDAKLEPFLLAFQSPEDVRSIGLDYSVRSHSLPVLVKGQLHLIVKTDQ